MVGFRQQAYHASSAGKSHAYASGVGVQQSQVGGIIGQSDVGMKKRLGISDKDEAMRTVERLASFGGVMALAKAEHPTRETYL